MVWSSAQREIYFFWKNLFFFQLQLFQNYWVFIYQLFCDFENLMSLYGRFRFQASTCFPEVICPKYEPESFWCTIEVFFISWKSHAPCSRYSIFCVSNHFINSKILWYQDEYWYMKEGITFSNISFVS